MRDFGLRLIKALHNWTGRRLAQRKRPVQNDFPEELREVFRRQNPIVRIDSEKSKDEAIREPIFCFSCGNKVEQRESGWVVDPFGVKRDFCFKCMLIYLLSGVNDESRPI